MTNPKIFALYYDRFDSATTSLELSAFGFYHTVLCHNNAERFTCIGEIGKLVETGNPKGIQHNMNAALDMVSAGDWAIIISDDYKAAYKFKPPCSFVKSGMGLVLSRLVKLTNEVDDKPIFLIGLNSTGNALFSKNPYGFNGLVDGRCFAIKKTEYRFHDEVSTIPDYHATAYHLAKHGQNLIYNHAYLEFTRYGKGGIGSIKDREETKRKDCEILTREFPDLLEYADKPGHAKGTHIRIVKRKIK